MDKTTRILKTAAICAAILLATACKKDNPKDAATLSLDKKANPVEFSAAATESFTYKVTTNQSSWDAKSNQTWCKVTKSADGKSFTLTADENKTTNAPAEATVTVTAGEATPIVIKATQKAADAALSIEPAPEGGKIEFPVEGDAKTFTVTTNLSTWNVESDKEWCKAEKSADGKSFTLTADENKTTAAPDEATVTVTAGEATPIVIKATQKAAGPSLSIAPAPEGGAVDFPAAGETKTFTVTTNLSAWEVVSDKEWCKAEKSADGKSFTLTADENKTITAPDEATVTVTAGDATPVVIKATQKAAAPSFSIEPAPEGGVVDFPAAGDTKTFTVTTNIPTWNVVSNKDWCKVTKSADGTQFTLTAAKNGFPTAKEDATVTVSAEGVSDIILTAKQAGTPLSVFGDDTVAASEYGGGNGTAGSPYLITSAAELKKLADGNMSDTRGKYYRLDVEIEVTAKSWKPIGSGSNDAFQGNFDGNGHTVSGELFGHINGAAGFFGFISAATVRNLTVDANITNNNNGNNYSGAIVGSMGSNTSISGCTAKGTVKHTVNILTGATIYCYTGGIAGEVQDLARTTTTIENCINHADVSSATGHSTGGTAYSYTGGIAGNSWGTVTGCTNNGSVTGATLTSSSPLEKPEIRTGGIVGELGDTGIMHLSVNKGAVTKGSGSIMYTGGIIGYSKGKPFSCNKNTGTVDGQPASDKNSIGYSPATGAMTPCTQGH